MQYTRFLSVLPLAALLPLGLIGGAFAQSPAAKVPLVKPPAIVAPAKNNPALSPVGRKQVFETVWKRVNDNYYDPTFGGINWKKVHDTYAPEVVKAQSDTAFYGLLQKMLGELKRSHFAIIPPAAYDTNALASDKTPDTNKKPVAPAVPKAESFDPSARDGEAGFEIRLVENQPVVWKVDEGSGAEKVGMKPGYLVTSIKNKPLAPIVAAVRKSVKEPGEAAISVRRALAQGLIGPIGGAVAVGVLDENNQPKTLSVPYDEPKGIPTKFGELPVLAVDTESKILPGNIGYIRFNIFLIPILQPVQKAIADMQAKNVSGIILDLRNNPGGIGPLSSAIAGSLFTKQTDLGVTTMRRGVTRFPVFPRPNPYTGPLVILTDEGSASTSEIMAGSLQEMGRATVVGQKTAGAVMPSYIENLPGTRARLQYAFADFKTPNGTLLEGRGVLPDVPVKLTRQAFLDNPDPELAAAIKYLNSKKDNQ